MNRWRPIQEVQLPILPLALALLVRHLRVLHHPIRLPKSHRHPNLLKRITLRTQLQTVLRLLHHVIPNKRRVRNLHKRIIHLEEENRLDPTLLHVRQRTRPLQRRQQPTMPIRTHKNMPRLIKNNLSILRHSWPHPLREEKHILRIQPKIIVLLKAINRRLIIHLRRHHIKRNPRPIPNRLRQNLPRMKIKKRRICHRSNRITPLRPIKPKPRTLTARHQQNAHAPRLQFLLTRRNRRLQRGTFQLRHLRRHTLRRIRYLRARLQRRLAPRQTLRIQRRNLFQQRRLLLLPQLLPILEHLLLPTRREHLFCFFVVHFLFPL